MRGSAHGAQPRPPQRVGKSACVRARKRRRGGEWLVDESSRWDLGGSIQPREVLTAQVRMSFRFSRRALLLAGRLPWLAFFNLRWGLAMSAFSYGATGKRSIIEIPSEVARRALGETGIRAVNQVGIDCWHRPTVILGPGQRGLTELGVFGTSPATFPVPGALLRGPSSVLISPCAARIVAVRRFHGWTLSIR